MGVTSKTGSHNRIFFLCACVYEEGRSAFQRSDQWTLPQAQILAARATPFTGPVVRAVINVSRSTKWRQDTGKTEARRRLQPVNPGDLREAYLGQTVVNHVQGQCADAGLPPVPDEAILASLLITAEVHERRLAEAARDRKAARQTEIAAA